MDSLPDAELATIQGSLAPVAPVAGQPRAPLTISRRSA
jgi:hypothetical protein